MQQPIYHLSQNKRTKKPARERETCIFDVEGKRGEVLYMQLLTTHENSPSHIFISSLFNLTALHFQLHFLLLFKKFYQEAEQWTE